MALMTESELLRDIESLTGPDYYPSDEVCEGLGAITLIPISSPQFGGKTTTIEAIEGMDPGFRLATSFTTRSRKPGEAPDAYHFVPHNYSVLSTIAGHALLGNYVQCTVHPNGRVYGSTVDDYHAPYSLLAPVSTEIEKLEKLPFDDIIPIYLVSHPNDYVRYIRDRVAQTGEIVGQQVLDEGISSLEWALSRGSRTKWVINSYGRQECTASEIIRIARGGEAQNPAGRKLGELLLDYLCELS